MEEKKKRTRRTAHQVWEEKVSNLEGQIESDTKRLEAKKQELEKLKASEPSTDKHHRLSNKSMMEYVALHPEEVTKAITEANGNADKLNSIISNLVFSTNE